MKIVGFNYLLVLWKFPSSILLCVLVNSKLRFGSVFIYGQMPKISQFIFLKCTCKKLKYFSKLYWTSRRDRDESNPKSCLVSVLSIATDMSKVLKSAGLRTVVARRHLNCGGPLLATEIKEIFLNLKKYDAL